MQGKKDYQEKLFTHFQLSDRVPESNFYRCLKESLALDFLYEQTEQYYGDCGQKSIDPVVFFKLCLVGYLENIISDRHLIEHCSMRIDILFFLGHDIDEVLPWHSTVSRTRQLFSEAVFDKVLGLCVEAGLVSGHTQALDSAPVKANASMDSLELKVPAETLESHLRRVRYMSTPDRQAKENKASEEEQTITATDQQLQEITSRNKKWKQDQDERPGAKRNKAKYTSNHTHYSPTDPDAKISVKPGKARRLNYTCQMGVDDSHHVITHIGADYANKKDNQSLQEVTLQLRSRLQSEGLLWHNLIADAGYSSGENYAFLEEEGLVSYISPHGTYKGGPDGFTYIKEEDHWECPNGQVIPFVKVFTERKNNIKKKEYRASKHVCKGCELRSSCLKSQQEKRITITYYREEYERAIARVKSKQGRRMKAKRQSTVEPVFGTLTQFMGLRKVNTKGIRQANKVMLLAGAAFNLKKLLKYTTNRVQTAQGQMPTFLTWVIDTIKGQMRPYKLIKIG